MSLSLFTIVIPLFYYYHIPAAANTFTAPHHHPIESLAINCGSHGNSTALDGREWTGDTQSSTWKLIGKSLSSSSSNTHNFLSFDFIPYSTARISRSPFTYSFQVDPGQKIIRFHFNPSPYRGFKSSIDLFTVRAGPFTLLSNFSPSITAAATGVKSFIKEYCLSVEETQALDIKFYPSRGSNSDKRTYAFVNGIEIVSMPAGLYYTREGDLGAKVVGHKSHFYIDNSTALEMIGRLNVGGKNILPIEDFGMFRGWSADSDYLVESNVVHVTTLTYILAHFAPMKVYQTTWSAGPKKQENEVCKITWRVPVDLGFRYLVRLHFSEQEVDILDNGQDEFSICLNSKIAEAYNDMIKWSNGDHIASCRDYVVVMEGDKMQGKHDLLIALRFKCKAKNQQINAKLHGIEIFKLSNPDNNLAGLNPLPSSKGSETRFSMAFGQKNAIATGMTLILALLNVIVYHQRVAWEANCKKEGKTISPKKQCRHFSLAEIKSATCDFDETFLIAKGGFGNVYRGLTGADIVAIKRSNPMSHQGANEFRTEIDMLSKLRHTNLVPLLGYCDESQEMILVYKYMDHGSLADHLHKIGGQVLSWEQRLEICIGAARGLDYLHTGGDDQQRVVHRDVKSSNILLDKDWVAKISDFGLSKVGPTNLTWTQESSKIKGTFGYLDPNYFMFQRLTTKLDVYAFGVVMFELLCERRAIDVTLEEEQHSLAQWAQNCIKEGQVHQIVDPCLKDQILPKSLKVFTKIAAKCLEKAGNRRATMADVVVRLEYALELQNNTNSDVTSQTTGNTTSSGGSNLSGNSRFSASSGSDEPYLSGQLLAAPSLRIFSFAELKAATRNFRNDTVLGEGAFGKVYKGWLDEKATSKNGSGSVIAVKKLHSDSIQGFQEWQSEVNFLGRLSHPNLVKLLGYCREDRELLLVYEFMQKGTLEDHLFGRGSAVQPLPWDIRIKILIGVAQGLAFLHTSEKQVIHRDFKPSNILLDGAYNAKMSDLGLAKKGPLAGQSYVSTRVMGTCGYAAPEYVATGHLYVKSDVYGFGVVLVEMLTGLMAVDRNRPSSKHNLVDWVKPRLSDRRKMMKVMDSRLEGKYPSKAAAQMAQLALTCLGNEPKMRPSMKQVLETLEQLDSANSQPKDRSIHSRTRAAYQLWRRPRSLLHLRQDNGNQTPLHDHHHNHPQRTQ